MDGERDKFLTEAMNECWHEFGETAGGPGFLECQCGAVFSLSEYSSANNNFSTPKGFFKLKDYLSSINRLDLFFDWYVAKRRKAYFGISIPCRVEFFKKCMLALLKTPDRFADAVYEFLKEIK